MRDDTDKGLTSPATVANPVVPCADALRAIYPQTKFIHYVWMIGGFFACQLLANWLKWDWLHVVPFIVFVAVLIPIIAKHQRQYRQIIDALVCPHCGQLAGTTFTKQGILHLRCRHCGEETRTDSLVLYKGPPTKV